MNRPQVGYGACKNDNLGIKWIRDTYTAISLESESSGTKIAATDQDEPPSFSTELFLSTGLAIFNVESAAGEQLVVWIQSVEESRGNRR